MNYKETEKEIERTRRIIKKIKGEIKQYKKLKTELKKFKGTGWVGKQNKKTGYLESVELGKWKHDGLWMLELKIKTDTNRLRRFEGALKIQLAEYNRNKDKKQVKT